MLHGILKMNKMMNQIIRNKNKTKNKKLKTKKVMPPH